MLSWLRKWKRFTEIKELNAELCASLQFMSDKYDNVLEKLNELEDAKKRDKHYISELEEKIETLERKAKMSGLEIRNIPKLILQEEKKVETREDLLDLTKKLAMTVNFNLQDAEIRDLYRVNSSKEELKPIIVDLTSVYRKEQFLHAIKTFNKTKPKGEKLNTSHLDIHGSARPVYVSETLTPRNQRLFYLAREFARDNKYQHRWTSKGLVYLRKAEGLKPIRIDHEADLQKLKNSA